MRDGILIQHACEGHDKLLDITLLRHAAYCQKWKLDFYLATERKVLDRNPTWEKVRLILDALRHGYEYVIWLDADCLIADFESDLREACPKRGTGVGMVYFGPEIAEPPHFNAGAIYIWNSPFIHPQPGVIEFFEAVWWDWPVDHPYEDQIAINRQAEILGVTITAIDNRWNKTPDLACDAPAVLAWHGMTLDLRERLMKHALGRLETEERRG